ncbi:MAG: hypothetical protein JXQ27_01825 [Acidobacteria bacterium]|nr:hypothetical protein [Acidobacteriota bacterium]
MNWKWATIYNMIPYLTGNIGGTLIYMYISADMMIIATVSVFPIVYMVFAYLYYRTTGHDGVRFFDMEWRCLTLYWIILSIALDALCWMFVLPAFVFPAILSDYPAHFDWTFFLHEAHHLWANYLSIILITIGGKAAWVFLRSRTKPPGLEHQAAGVRARSADK